MVDVKMVSYQIARLRLTNNIPEKGAVGLEATVGFNMIYEQKNRVAMAVLTASINHRYNPDYFYIELEIQGKFELRGIESIETKKIAHIRGYEILLLYANDIVNFLGEYSGLKNFSLPKIPIHFDGVNFGAKPENSVDSGKVILLNESDFL